MVTMLQVAQVCRHVQLFQPHRNVTAYSRWSSTNRYSDIKVISLDITGTIYQFSVPVHQLYAQCAVKAKLKMPPSAEELRATFKKAFREYNHTHPYLGASRAFSSRDWWFSVVKRCFQLTRECRDGSTSFYTDEELSRVFRLIYQHYGSAKAYHIFEDSVEFMKWTAGGGIGFDYSKERQERRKYSLGVISNAATRTIESILPALELSDYIDWSICSYEVQSEKPEIRIFDEAYKLANFWAVEKKLVTGQLRREQILHIGDNFALDYCGAKAAGFQVRFSVK